MAYRFYISFYGRTSKCKKKGCRHRHIWQTFTVKDQPGSYQTRSHNSKRSWKEDILKRLFLYSYTFSKILLFALYLCLVCV